MTANSSIPGLLGALRPRRSQRIALTGTLRVLTPTPVSGTLRDVGAGGLGVHLDAPLPVGESCTLRALTSGGHEVVETARVAWVAPRDGGWHAGLAFEPVRRARLASGVVATARPRAERAAG